MDAHKKGFVAGVAVGATAGTALAALLTPTRGEETRQRLGSWGKGLGVQGREAAEQAITKSKETASRGRERLSGEVEKLRTRLYCDCPADELPADGEVRPT